MVFLTLNFVIDTIFEIFYCLFPLVFLTNNSNIFDLTSLGLLGQQNGFIIIQSLFAMIMLVRKCIVLFQDLNPTHIAKSHWINVITKIKTDNLTPWIVVNKFKKKVKYSGFGNNELYRLVVARHETNDTVAPRTSIIDKNFHDKDTTKHNIHKDTDKDKDKEKQDQIPRSTHATNDHEENRTRKDFKFAQKIQLFTMRSNSHKDEEHSSYRDEAQSISIVGDIIDTNNHNGAEKKKKKKNTLQSEHLVDTNVYKEAITASRSPSVEINGDEMEFDHELEDKLKFKTEDNDLDQFDEIEMELERSSSNIFENSYTQCRRKGAVTSCGILLIVFGVLILTFFLSFIENDYNNKCIDINDKEWLIEHPELEFFDRYCLKKVVNMFSDYPCNCRLLSAPDVNVSQFTNKIVEKSVIHYNNLEGFYMDAENNPPYSLNQSYYFNQQMFEDLVCYTFSLCLPFLCRTVCVDGFNRLLLSLSTVISLTEDNSKMFATSTDRKRAGPIGL